MRKAEYPEEIRTLVAQLKRLPGIGPRSAERVAISLLTTKTAVATDLARALDAAVQGVSLCPVCGFFQSRDRPCALCDAPDRDRSLLCIVEQPTDILPLERTGAYHGHYHVLGGRLSPLDNIHPENLRIEPLTRRLADSPIREIILATGSDVEGEATAHYLADHLTSLSSPDHPFTITRLAQGLPAGGGLDHADDLTLHRALSGRRAV
ncbi:MAG: recombination mediator RecR [Verrucomicrobiales bacterium]